MSRPSEIRATGPNGSHRKSKRAAAEFATLFDRAVVRPVSATMARMGDIEEHLIRVCMDETPTLQADHAQFEDKLKEVMSRDRHKKKTDAAFHIAL